MIIVNGEQNQYNLSGFFGTLPIILSGMILAAA